MILDDYKNNDYNEINLFKLSEETIRIVNQLLTNLDDKGTPAQVIFALPNSGLSG